MTAHLLLVSLGPVQDFIASARRCQDLWFGSVLLSSLSRAVAIAMRDAAGAESLIFPGSLEDGQGKPAVANKILVRVPAGTTPQRVSDAGRAAMDLQLERFATEAFERMTGKAHFELDAASKQVSDLMEFDWVSVPCDSDYDAARRAAESLLACRKNTKNWGPVGEWSKGVPKSSLDGQRESVLNEALYDERKGSLTKAQLRQEYHVKPAERLCGVGLLKRIGTDIEEERARRPSFHSTSHVASAPLRARIARALATDPQMAQALDSYERCLRKHGVNLERFAVRPSSPAACTEFSWGGESLSSNTPSSLGLGQRHVDGYLLYEDRLRDVIEEYSSVAPAGVAAAERELRGKLADVLRVAKASPGAYYAVLLADGDSMGRAIGRLKTLPGHQRLGMAVDDFSGGCEAIVRAHAGSLIYAGGDDVLALLPLHTALACAEALTRSFAAHVGHVEGLGGAVPTLSVGLGIAHHMEDMADARALAKLAEGLAKKFVATNENGETVAEKNALGIVLSKRSGGALEVVGSWSRDVEPLPLRARIDDWCRRYHAEEISSKAAFDLEQTVAPFLMKAPGLRGTGAAKHALESQRLDAVVASLARGVLGRKRAERGGADMQSEVRQELSVRLDGRDVRGRVKALSDELQLARVFLDAYETAFPEVIE